MTSADRRWAALRTYIEAAKAQAVGPTWWTLCQVLAEMDRLSASPPTQEKRR